jgi:hypothetical protein
MVPAADRVVRQALVKSLMDGLTAHFEGWRYDIGVLRVGIPRARPVDPSRSEIPVP